MRSKTLFVLTILFAVAAAGSARVRISVQNGKRVIYNDGVGEKSLTAGRKRSVPEGQWLAARIGRPSEYDPLINRAASVHSLDPRLVKSVMLVESGFNPAAVSPKGARGLMQLMPATASRHGVRNIHDPAQNIAGERSTSRTCSASSAATSRSRWLPTTRGRGRSRDTAGSLPMTKPGTTCAAP